jgi:hypothetical protein
MLSARTLQLIKRRLIYVQNASINGDVHAEQDNLSISRNLGFRGDLSNDISCVSWLGSDDYSWTTLAQNQDRSANYALSLDTIAAGLVVV